MQQIELLIVDPDGIHARPAGILVKKMQEFPCQVTLTKGDRQADLKKLFALMKLAVKKGDTITIMAEGDGEEEALAAAIAVAKENELIEA